jgi:hypothetical protein
MTRYPEETLPEYEDDGTMPDNVDELRRAVIGHRIVKAEQRQVDVPWYPESPNTHETTTFVLTLDDGREVRMVDTYDCCASTELEAFLLHPELVDHVIIGVGTTDGYTRWHIYADMGDVLELTVGWSAGNPFYYGYEFYIFVVETP